MFITPFFCSLRFSLLPIGRYFWRWFNFPLFISQPSLFMGPVCFSSSSSVWYSWRTVFSILIHSCFSFLFFFIDWFLFFIAATSSFQLYAEQFYLLSFTSRPNFRSLSCGWFSLQSGLHLLVEVVILTNSF